MAPRPAVDDEWKTVSAPDEGEWKTVSGPKDQSAPKDTRGFFESAIDKLNPLPAIREWMNRPTSVGHSQEAFHALTRLHNEAANDPANKGLPPNKWKVREPTPEEHGVIERGMNTPLPGAEGNILNETTAPSVEAYGQARQGNYAGAAGTMVGAYGVPAAAASPMVRAVTRDAAVGGFKGGMAPTSLPIKIKGVPIAEVSGVPASVSGAAAGAGMGHFVPGIGSAVGAGLGAAAPIVRGAIQGVKKGILERKIAGQRANPTTPAWANLPEGSMPPPEPPISPATQSLSGRAPGGMFNQADATPPPAPRRAALWKDLPEGSPSPFTMPPPEAPAALPSGRIPGKMPPPTKTEKVAAVSKQLNEELAKPQPKAPKPPEERYGATIIPDEELQYGPDGKVTSESMKAAQQKAARTRWGNDVASHLASKGITVEEASKWTPEQWTARAAKIGKREASVDKIAKAIERLKALEANPDIPDQD